MIKLFKRLFTITAALLIVGVLIIIAIVTLVDPNNFKGLIENQITTDTGYTATIRGPIHWQLDPGFSLEIYDLSLTNTGTSDPFLTLKKAKIDPKFWSLLSGKLWANLQLQGLNVRLNRHMIGHINREVLPHLILTKKFNLLSSLFLVPYDLNIEEGNISWQDPNTEQNVVIQNLTLSLKKLPLGATGFLVPISSHFHFEDLAHHQTGQLSFHSEWCFDKKLQAFDVQNIKFTADIEDFPTTIITGDLNIQPFKNLPIIAGKLHTTNVGMQWWWNIFRLPHVALLPKTLDLKSTFKYEAPFLEITSFTASLDTGGTIEGSFKTELGGKTFKTLSLNGTLQGKDLRIGTFPLTEIKMLLDAKEGIYHFNQIQAQYLNSQQQGELQIDLRNPIPQLSFSTQLDSFDINELLSFFKEKDKLSGSAHVKTSLTTYGITLEECLAHLSGTAEISLLNGKLRGIALPPLLQHAQSTISLLTEMLLKKQPVNVAAVLTAELGEWKQQAINHYQPLVTPFKLVETKFTIYEGKMNTSDFELTHPEYTIRGQGSLDLIQEKMEYQASALLHPVTPLLHASPSVSTFLQETPLAIHIKGPLNNLSVNPDLARYAAGALKLVQKESPDIIKENSLEKLFGFP